MESFMILLVIVLGFLCVVVVISAESAGRKWRAECVRRGFAEWVILDEHGKKEWRWKENDRQRL